jgi:thioesterase domain-containing protein
MVTLLTNSTIRELASALVTRGSPASTRSVAVPKTSEEANAAYQPVVKLREKGTKTPMWFFHPGVGEVLVFLNLAKFLDDRPVYALRARGFEKHETFFSSIHEAVHIYYRAIKTVQPNGPYALSGYSYGAMLAFETAKLLEQDHTTPQVQFLASFNLPPHIAFRMQQLDWVECALHLAYFLGLLPERRAADMSAELRTLPRATVLGHLLAAAAPGRMEELSLTPSRFAHWADLAHAMQSMARAYEPCGRVPALDVFYCEPLAAVARDKRQWLDEHLQAWADFCLEQPRYHDVRGRHYTMIDQTHVIGFQRVLRDALRDRGL